MVRFSCFQAHLHSIKPKKTVQPSIEATAKTLQDSYLNQPSTNSSIPSSHPLHMEALEYKQMNNSKDLGSNLASVEYDWSSDDLKSKFVNVCDREVRHAGHLKRSQSLKSGLYQEGRHYTCNLTDGETDPSSNGSKSYNESMMPGCKKDQEANLADQSKKNSESEFHVSSALRNNGSIFSIGDPTPSDKDAHENSDTPLSGECAGDFADLTLGLGTPTLMVKSCSLPNLGACATSSEKCSLKHADSISQSRSSEDLLVLGMRQKVIIGRTEETQMDNYHDDGYDSHRLSGLAKDWVVPVVDDVKAVKILPGESSPRHLDELPHNDFKIKRIEDWVTDLQHYGPLEGTYELSESIDPLNDNVNNISGVTSARMDIKVIPGMEAAKRYMSSLGINATAAQLANHGFAVIPFISAFASLKVLNLSGNAIVRITAGALPRGLHILNLSRNNISAIEGLRELTRLRVLDLSYNRIFRIGHGLASCSSLKELYLAGNKIGEVEGLHRLLKLSILDLRFNKISTAKCLGQLAANYNSLQAISLEGNPAQKNVGDEQLKKYVQGLLPQLVYYNRQPIKASTLKDAADRSVRLGISSYQFDRNLRSDHKTTRKGSHGVAARKPTVSSTHARRSQTEISPKRSKGRQGHLPPIGTKVSTQNRDFGSKPLKSGSDLSHIRRSRSEGTI